MKRYVTLGEGKRVSLGAYVLAWKSVLASQAGAVFKGSPRDPRGWSGSYSRDQVLEEFRAGLAERINRHLPWYGKGRKWSSDWFWLMWRTSRDLNNPRIAIHWLPPELRERFGYRLAS